jgi:superfamily II DNA/RNA helicase
VEKTLSVSQKQFVIHLVFYLNVFMLFYQGSGKTLAYGLPILHYLLSQPRKSSSKTKRRQLKALILAPTRELALQVSVHLKECLNPASASAAKEDPADASVKGTESKITRKHKKPASNPEKPRQTAPLVSVAAIVGGMSTQKQRRILDRGLDVLVATPGRLWDIMEEVSPYRFIPSVITLLFPPYSYTIAVVCSMLMDAYPA